MVSLKDALLFLGLFTFLSIPALFFYQTPKKHTAEMKLTEITRGIASTMKPATRTCETIQRVRWKCATLESGEKKCHRDGFDNVRHCKSL